jgi:hypothetical protein
MEHLLTVGIQPNIAQQPAVNDGVKGLYSTVQHLRKLGYIGNLLQLKSGLSESPRRAASADKIEALGDKALGKRDNSRFIGNA